MRLFFTSPILYMLAPFLLTMSCEADTVILGGKTYIGSGLHSDYPIIDTFSLGASSAQSVALPNGDQGFITSVAVGPTGIAIFVGQDQITNLPFIYALDITENQSTVIAIPDAPLGRLNSVAIGPDGVAIMGGLNNSNGTPLIYKVALGGSVASVVTVPSEDSGSIYSVAIGSNGVAILVGVNGEDRPLIYQVVPEATTTTSIAFPEDSYGGFNSVAIGPDNSAILGGSIGTEIDYDSYPAVYKIAAGSTIATVISPPNDNRGHIVAVSIGSDGTAILGGAYEDDTTLIWQVAPNASNATVITPPNDHHATAISLAIGLDGTALLGGQDFGEFGHELQSPFIYTVAKGASYAQSLVLPDDDGSIECIAIASDGTAILAGNNFGTGLPIIYSLAQGATTVSSITPAATDEGGFVSVAIYNDRSYDINRLKVIYEGEVIKAKIKLYQAGLIGSVE